MSRANLLSLVALLSAASGAALGQPLPDRPEKLFFKPLSFAVPKASEARVLLRNKVPVYLVPGPEGIPLVRVSVSCRGGGYMEPRGKEGLAGLYGSQLALGGTKSIDPAALEDRLERMAATLSSSCGETSCSLSLQVREKDVAEGLELLRAVLAEPAFAADRLELARRAARQALERRNDSVTSIAQAEFPALLFGEGFFMVPDATAASLDSVTREDLLAFHARLQNPANMVVAVSGAVERKKFVGLLDGAIGSLKAGPSAEVSPKVPAPSFARAPGLYVCDKDAPQAMVQWAFPGIRRSDPDWYPAMVMNHILGGSFTGRLMKRIRSDEGLTYGVRTSLGEGPYFRGDLVGSLQTKNRSVAYALRLALGEMQRLKDEPLTPAELKAVKEGLIESFPAQWSSRSAIAARFVEERLVGWPEDWWTDFREKVQGVTPADVQRMAKKLLDTKALVVLAVGKGSEIEAGDPDHPGELKAVAPLPLSRLPLRDPLTLLPKK